MAPAARSWSDPHTLTPALLSNEGTKRIWVLNNQTSHLVSATQRPNITILLHGAAQFLPASTTRNVRFRASYEIYDDGLNYFRPNLTLRCIARRCLEGPPRTVPGRDDHRHSPSPIISSPRPTAAFAHRSSAARLTFFEIFSHKAPVTMVWFVFTAKETSSIQSSAIDILDLAPRH